MVARIALVHPLGYRADAASSDIARLANIMPPIGLASIAAWMERKGIQVTLTDCYAKPGATDHIRQLLQDTAPGFLGLSCTTSSFLDAVRIAQLAKSVLPAIKTIVGGPHVSALKALALEGFPAIDFGVVGEGEETLTELVEGGWEQPDKMKGLVYRGADGTTRWTGYRDSLLDLDALPFPAYEKLEGYPGSYKLPIFNYPRAPNTSCVSSRGCPYACSYCDRSVFGKSFRFNSADYMIAHVRSLQERFGIRHINFYDDQFTFNRKRVESFARQLVDQSVRVTYNCAARAEHLDEDLLRVMKESGCWMISLGIETGDPDLLAQHRQRADLDLMRDRILMIKRAGIRVKGLLMMGLPGETEASVRRSMQYVYSLPIDDFNVAKFTPFPGSPIYEKIRELGTFDEDWEKMDCMHFQFIPKGMEREQMERLFIDFYRGHFMSPRVLWDYTSMIWRSPDSWLRFFHSAASFLKFAASNRRLGDKETIP